MSIIIKKETCIGCGKCSSVCPGSLIQMDEDGKAFMKYPKDCWGCASCLKECHTGAIGFYLGADIGGMGSRMYVTEEGDYFHWNVTKATGETETITINRKDSNHY